MKAITIYRFDLDDDCWAKRIEEAFNRLLEFAHDLRSNAKEKPRALTAFNRIINGEFNEDDVYAIDAYGRIVAQNATTKYSWPPFSELITAESILQSAENLKSTVAEFHTWFEEQKTAARP